MEWVDVKEKLPCHECRVLAYCVGSKDDIEWRGIVDVTFDSNVGWFRCEDPKESVFVTHWFDYPVEPPQDEQ